MLPVCSCGLLWHIGTRSFVANDEYHAHMALVLHAAQMILIGSQSRIFLSLFQALAASEKMGLAAAFQAGAYALKPLQLSNATGYGISWSERGEHSNGGRKLDMGAPTRAASRR